MSQYVRQRDESGCGPIAILNAMKWANPEEKFTYNNHYKELCFATGKTRNGVDPSDFREGLIYAASLYNFSIVKVRKFDYARMMDHLDKGGALILGHYEIPQEGVKDYEPHYSFWIDGDEEGTIHGVNVLRKPAATVNSFESLVLTAINARTMIHLGEKMEIFLLTRKD